MLSKDGCINHLFLPCTHTNLGNWEWKGTDSDESDRQTLYMEITSSSHVVMGPKTDFWKSRIQSGKNPYWDPGS